MLRNKENVGWVKFVSQKILLLITEIYTKIQHLMQKLKTSLFSPFWVPHAAVTCQLKPSPPVALLYRHADGNSHLTLHQTLHADED